MEVPNAEKKVVSMRDGLPVIHKEEAEPVKYQCLQVANIPPNGTHDEKANSLERRSLLVARRFRERLAGPNKCFLLYLQNHHSVMIFQDPARGKVHIKGSKKNVLECYAAVRTLLTE